MLSGATDGDKQVSRQEAVIVLLPAAREGPAHRFPLCSAPCPENTLQTPALPA